MPTPRYTAPPLSIWRPSYPRQWSNEGDGVVKFIPRYDAFIKRLKATIASSPRPAGVVSNARYCDMVKLEAALARPESKIPLLCSPQNPTGKVRGRVTSEVGAARCIKRSVP